MARPVSSRGALLRLLLVICLILSGYSCRPAGEKVAPLQDFAFQQQYGEAPCIVTFRLSHLEMTTAEILRLELLATMPEDLEAVTNIGAQELGKFTIIRTTSDEPRLIGVQAVERLVRYDLRPFLPGDYSLPPLEIVFQKRGDGSLVQKVMTEGQTISVRSVLPAEENDPQPQDIAPPVTMRTRLWVVWLSCGIAAMCLLLGAYFYIRWRRQRRSGLEAFPSAQALARDELDWLLGRDLIAQGAVKMFYQEISDILRRYLERQFSLKAPERTTEEFLAEISCGTKLQPSQQELLSEFLTQCDRVKFGAFLPAESGTARVIELCRLFIEETEFPPGGRAPQGSNADAGGGS